MAETPEGRAVDYAGTKGPEQRDGSFVPAFNDEKSFLYQRDGSFGYHLLNI